MVVICPVFPQCYKFSICTVLVECPLQVCILILWAGSNCNALLSSSTSASTNYLLLKDSIIWQHCS